MTDDISVQRFFDVIEQSGIFMHGAVMMENNRVIAQRYWRPFSQNKLHRMYSVTKSFVSVAIGMLSDEGKLKLSDKAVPIFRQELGLLQLHPYIEDMTIRDLLMMAAPFGKLTYGENDRDWLKSMFVSTPDHPPGTVFRYDSGASYVLGAIVKRKSGKNFVEYMRPLFDKIGFSKEAYCLQGPDGELWSGSGLMASTLDLAKFAQLLVNRGKWNGEQLVSEEYVTEATKMQICNFDDGNDSAWNRGYGYQIWILKDDAFFLNGMGGQLAIGFPKHNFVFACTADVQGNPCGKDVILNALWNEIVSKLTPPVPDKPEKKTKTFLNKINGVTYRLGENPMGIKEFQICFAGKEGNLKYINSRGEKTVHFGTEDYKEFLFPEYYNGERLFDESCKKMYLCIGKCIWVEPHKLMIKIYAVGDYIGNLTMVFSFKGDEVGVKMAKNAQFFFHGYEGYAGGWALK